MDRLAGAARQRVLDLGPAIGANVSFLAQLHCTLHIVDLQHDLLSGAIGATTSARAFGRWLEDELPIEEPSADAILVWDLLNYLSTDQIKVLGEHLARHCHPGTRLLVLISTRERISDAPLRFEIEKRNGLAYDTPATVNRPCPRYREPDLERLLPDFAVEVSYLLRNGFQEYILSYSPRPLPIEPPGARPLGSSR